MNSFYVNGWSTCWRFLTSLLFQKLVQNAYQLRDDILQGLLVMSLL